LNFGLIRYVMNGESKGYISEGTISDVLETVLRIDFVDSENYEYLSKPVKLP